MYCLLQCLDGDNTTNKCSVLALELYDDLCGRDELDDELAEVDEVGLLPLGPLDISSKHPNK